MTGAHEDRARAQRGMRFDEVLSRLDAASSVVITTHANADGDGAGSEIALAAFLRARGADAWIVNPTPFPESLDFLLPDRGWVLPPRSSREARYCSEADLAVVLDTAQVPRIGRVKSLIRHLPKVVIDHHPPSNRPIDGLVVCDTSACATGALVFELIDRAGGPWPPPVAHALYVAVMTDTGGFRFSNTDRDCFRVAARLVELGAEPETLFRAVYGRFRVRRFELLREALATLAVHPDGRIAWMTVPKDAYDRVGAAVDDLEGFVDVPRDIDGVQVAMLFRTTADGRIKVSLRSVPPIDVGTVAAGFGGGGHARAAAAVVTGPLDDVIARVLRRVERIVDDQGARAGHVALPETLD